MPYLNECRLPLPHTGGHRLPIARLAEEAIQPVRRPPQQPDRPSLGETSVAAFEAARPRRHRCDESTPPPAPRTSIRSPALSRAVRCSARTAVSRITASSWAPRFAISCDSAWVGSCLRHFEHARPKGSGGSLEPGLGAGRSCAMTEAVRLRDIENDKARRRAARMMIGEYHEHRMSLLLERVRHGSEQLDRARSTRSTSTVSSTATSAPTRPTSSRCRQTTSLHASLFFGRPLVSGAGIM